MLFEKSDETVKHIRKGLKIISPEGDLVIHPPVSDNPAILRDADIIFLFVKSYSTDGAIDAVSRAARNDSIIVSLQNGLGNFESINRVIPEERIVYGTTTFGAARLSPGEVIFGGRGMISIGGASAAAIENVRLMLQNAGCDVHVTENPARSVWMKVLINAGINPIASILGITNGEILKNSYALKVQESIMEEAVAAAQANGFDFDYNSILAETRSICDHTAANTCSMLQDINSGRKTEIESINMKIAEFGQAAGLEMRSNTIVSMLVKALEKKYRSSPD